MYCTTMSMLWFSLNSSVPSESEFVILSEFATRVTSTRPNRFFAISLSSLVGVHLHVTEVHLGLHAKIN